MEINTWIHKVLAHGADLNLGAGPVPLREGVDKTRVSQLESVFWPFAQFYPLTTLIFSCRAICAPRGVTLPKDMAKREVNRAHNKTLQTRK
jgi:hypothetical protein